MHRITRHLHAYAWIAALAILFNALAPVVSQAQAHAYDRAQGSAGAAQMEICTAMGVAMVSMPASNDGSDQGHLLKAMSHCAYCGTHAGSFGLPPHAAPIFAVQGGHDVFPPLFYQSPATLFTWSRFQARAPPATA